MYGSAEKITKSRLQCASMGSPVYKIVLGMSYYIHSGGPGALVDVLRPFFKESTEGAANVLLPGMTSPHPATVAVAIGAICTVPGVVL